MVWRAPEPSCKLRPVHVRGWTAGGARRQNAGNGQDAWSD